MVHDQRSVVESIEDVLISHSTPAVFLVIPQRRDELPARVPSVTALKALQQRLLTDLVTPENSPAIARRFVCAATAFLENDLHSIPIHGR